MSLGRVCQAVTDGEAGQAQGQTLELLPPAALAELAGMPGRSAPPVTPAQLAGGPNRSVGGGHMGVNAWPPTLRVG